MRQDAYFKIRELIRGIWTVEVLSQRTQVGFPKVRRLRGYIFLLAGVSNHCLERTGPQTDMHQLPGEARYDDDVEKIPDHNTDVDCAEHSGISSLDADYLARTARNDIRKSTFGAMSKLRSDPLSIPFNERYVAISYAEGTTKERNIDSFSTTFFNWEVVKRDIDPFVYRLPCADVFPFEISPRRSRNGNRFIEDEENVEVLIMVKYKLGSGHRSIFFSTPLRKAVFEGRMCACCRFHDVLTDHNGLCLVHRGK